MIYHIFIFVVNITPMLLAHGNKFKSVNSKSRIIFKDVTIKTEKDNYVVFASSKEYQLAIPVIINHEKFRNSIDIVSIDSTDWIIYSNVSQRVTIRMYLLNAS